MIVDVDKFYDTIGAWVESPNFNATTEGDITDYYIDDVLFAYKITLPDGTCRYWVRAEID